MQKYSRSPGKVILIGEHAVVYNKPAIVACIDLYASAQVKKYKKDKVKFVLTRFNFEQEFYWEDVFHAYKDSEDNVRKFKETGDNKYLERLKDFSKLPKMALVEVLKYAKIKDPEGIILSGDSEIPIGGFGASSAAAAAVVSAYSRFLGLDLTDDEQTEIVLRAETLIHGFRPSGIDQSVVVRGGVLKYQKDEENKMKVDPINGNSELLSNVIIIQSGKPNESTGQVVEMVRQRRLHDPKIVDHIFGNLEIYTGELEKSLIESNKDLFYEIIDKSGEELIRLGIVSTETQSLIKKIQELGGHIKVSGAGTVTGSGSGALICFSENPTQIIKYVKKLGLEYFLQNLG